MGNVELFQFGLENSAKLLDQVVVLTTLSKHNGRGESICSIFNTWLGCLNISLTFRVDESKKYRYTNSALID